MAIGTIFMCPFFSKTSYFAIRLGFVTHGTITYFSCLMPDMIENYSFFHRDYITVGKGICCNKNK